MVKQLHAVQTISYGDIPAHLFLWQKAILLVPIWAILIIPIVGFICRGFGPVVSEFGYALMLGSCILYFFVDLLKRKIRVDDEYIYFGFKAIPIKSIQGIDVIYKKGKLLPSSLLLRSSSGKNLKFSLNGMSEKNVSNLLKHIEIRNSNLQIAPVLNTLMKCRQSSRKLALETSDRLELPYHAKQMIDESFEVFKSTARHWIRVGPVIVCFCFGPMWISFFSNLYTCLQQNSWQQLQTLGLHQFLTKFFEGSQHSLGKTASSTSEAFSHLANNPIMLVITGGAILAFLIYMQRLATKPNVLIADKNELKLQLRIGDFAMPAKKIAWADIDRASLYKPKNHAGSKTWKIRLTKTNGKNFDVDLAALAADDRSTLLKRMEKLIPDCQIDYELSQSMRPQAAHSYTEIWLQSLNQAPERKALEPLQPGQTIGDNRFEVLKSIGVGGQGTAYLCREISDDSNKTVVLKETIIPVFGDQSIRRKALESVEQESRLLQSLDSDGIVKLLDHFIEDHRAYLVMEHIDGGSLRELIENRGPLSHEQARDIALQMCDILKVLHSRDIVHRDFTPDNLILNSKGKLKLIDFNVAQQVQGGSTGTIVGKHAYLPPEQFRGKATSQSDLYAFGASLFFILTGRDPEPISQSSPAVVNEEIDKSFDNIVKRATALQTSGRYKSAEEIESDLLSMDDQGKILSTASRTVEVVEHG